MSWNYPEFSHLARSRVRTRRLWCSRCRRPIKKGEMATFWIDDKGRWFERKVVCDECVEVHEQEELDTHLFSEDALQ